MNRMRMLGVFAAVVFSSTPSLALAAFPTAGIVTCSGAIAQNGQQACTVCDIANTAQNVINTGIYIVVFLATILFVYAGGKYLTAEGNSGAISAAHKIFFNVAIGLIIILSSWLIVDTIMKALFKQDTQFGPWNKICLILADRSVA